MTAPLCFIDTETTGVHQDRKVWEVAMIRRDDTGERQTTFFVDVDLSNADPFGLKVGRFYERHPVGRWIAGLSGPIEIPIGGEAWHYHLIDVEALAVGYLSALIDVAPIPDKRADLRVNGRPDLPWRSEDLSRACGVEPASEDERHTALGDARWAMRLYDAITSGSKA